MYRAIERKGGQHDGGQNQNGNDDTGPEDAVTLRIRINFRRHHSGNLAPRNAAGTPKETKAFRRRAPRDTLAWFYPWITRFTC